MDDPQKAVVLSEEQVVRLNQLLADMRHNVNNNLTLVAAAAEILQRKPESAPRILETLMQQPRKITDEIRRFSDEFEKALNIVR